MGLNLDTVRPGDKIIYAHPENGYATHIEPDRENAKQHLILKAIYTVAAFDSLKKKVTLEEAPDAGPLNTVLFDPAVS